MKENSYNNFDESNPLEEERKEEINSKKCLINMLQNLEKDLILQNNCPKEFDLNNNSSQNVNKIEIFGNPRCYKCTKVYKKDSPTQFFYCSHCNKLFCRNCLSDHYKSNFVNIENSYSKYLKVNNRNFFNKTLSIEMGCLKKFFYKLFLFLFTSIYMVNIFFMKPVINTLLTIIINCIKEIFTHRIEDPDSLFNFYEIFFSNINILKFDFDLIMIMNWLGDSLLYYCGFGISTLIFSSINAIFYVLLTNFDFLDYNENNKYGIWKFIHLLLIYITIFIGLGGSSLLSQKIFIEIYQKYEEQLNEIGLKSIYFFCEKK